MESGKLKTETGNGRQKLTRTVVKVPLPLMPLKMKVGSERQASLQVTVHLEFLI